MDSLSYIAIAVIATIVGIAIIWWILSRLYQRSSTQVSFVRTGFLGRKVVISGGAFVIPVLHDVIRVNMNTLRLGIVRSNENAVITQDRMRVDIEADFYVRVDNNKSSVGTAAQALGARTMSAEQMQDLLEGKFIDSVRAAAAERSLEILHEGRFEFSSAIRERLGTELEKNGLTLESVSITRLDQTDRQYFNPNNAFDAAGLTKLIDEIESRRKRRNEIEQDAQIAVQEKNLQAECRLLEITRDEEYARLEQERQVAIRRAENSAQIKREASANNRAADEAEVVDKKMVELTRIESDLSVEEERIKSDLGIRTLKVAQEKAIEVAEIGRRKAIEIAEQESEIEVAEQTGRRAEAQAAAELKRAEAVRAEEAVVSARDFERAQRNKTVRQIEAEMAAQERSISARGTAETEAKIAIFNAEAIGTIAEAESSAEKLRAAASELRYSIDAAGKKALNEADNAQSAESIEMKVRLAMIEHLEGIVRESVKPMEKIDGIKIVQVDGLNPGGGSGNSGDGSGGNGGSSGSLSDQLVQSALRYRSHAPLIDSILKDIGLEPAQVGLGGSGIDRDGDS